MVAGMRKRLDAATKPKRLDRLGFAREDQEALLALLTEVVDDRATVVAVAARADELRDAVGTLDGATPPAWPPGDEAYAPGAVDLLALLLTVDHVRAFHRSRGVPDDVGWATLADLGQQVWVHRQTYGTFGLHTQEWLRLPWAGNLYRLGRLQFDLVDTEHGRLLSTHIPETGPLTPAAVDDAFAQARAFFPAHFPDLPVDALHCYSWLLDPHLAKALPGSNLAAFQRRWTLYGEPGRGDADVLFFTFRRRGGVDLATLPRTTRLERTVVDRLSAGKHWRLWNGRVAW